MGQLLITAMLVLIFGAKALRSLAGGCFDWSLAGVLLVVNYPVMIPIMSDCDVVSCCGGEWWGRCVILESQWLGAHHPV